jgi:hypothetical protein
MRYYDILSRQLNDVLDRDSKTCPHQFWMQKRPMSELPISVRHEVLAMWNAEGGGNLYELVEIAQRELDKFVKPPLSYNRPPTTQTNTQHPRRNDSNRRTRTVEPCKLCNSTNHATGPCL